MLQALVFLVGLLGFGALVAGIAYWSVPAALIIGGILAIWWSWYVSIGARLQLAKLQQGKSE